MQTERQIPVAYHAAEMVTGGFVWEVPRASGFWGGLGRDKDRDMGVYYVDLDRVGTSLFEHAITTSRTSDIQTSH